MTSISIPVFFPEKKNPQFSLSRTIPSPSSIFGYLILALYKFSQGSSFIPKIWTAMWYYLCFLYYRLTTERYGKYPLSYSLNFRLLVNPHVNLTDNYKKKLETQTSQERQFPRRIVKRKTAYIYIRIM